MAQSFVYNFTRSTTLAGTSISTGPTLLGSVCVNTSGLAPNALALFNGTSTAAAQVAILNVLGSSTNLSPYSIAYDVLCPLGLFLSNTGGTVGDATVTWA